jgi:hypothetical protein
VCADCAVLSIETGVPIAICVSCAGAAAAAPASPVVRQRPWNLFRTGAGFILLGIAGACAVALQREGWPGLWSVLLTILHPSILLGLVPLAVVIGAVVAFARRVVSERVRD